MSGAWTSESMSPGLLKVAERAKRCPDGKFHSLAHLIDEAALARAYDRVRKDAAVGVDGITKEQYGERLEENLGNLHERLRTKRYRHQPIRRVHIPKEKGKTRPIGVSTVEDKVVQEAIREVLEAIYEQDFEDCSFGFRPGRGAHGAIRTLNRAVYAGEVNWILEADLVSFFDSIDRKRLSEMLQVRVADGSILRLVGKCMHAGVLDGEEYSEPEQGTAQGSILSPLLGNIYLHYALDLWFEQVVKPRLKGKAIHLRFADDFLMGFERQDDAERVMAALPKRMGRFGLTLHPEKTRLLPFQRPKRKDRGKGPGTFDFLGFTMYWRRSRRGHWGMWCKTKRARLVRAIRAVHGYCRSHRHLPVKEQHAALSRRLRGHYNYFGVNGNSECLETLEHIAKRAWYKWLNRRSQRSRLNWQRYLALLRRFPLPQPRIVVQIWGAVP